MRKGYGGRLCALMCGAAALSVGVSGGQAWSQEQETNVEEVVITGSFIRRSEGFQASSPVDVLQAAEVLEEKAPTNLANVFAEMPANFGSAFSTGRALGGGERGLGTVNLRGLGAAATLVLLNGHRQTQVADSPDNIVDVNSLVPDIMVQRIEVLKDGASALYGTDAVAGVVNVITNDRFEGLRLAARVNYFDYSNVGDYQLQGMWGSTFAEDRGHIVAALSFVQQDPMNSTFDAPVLGRDRNNLRYTIASGSPGRYVVPLRDAAGAVRAGAGSTATRVDPMCGTVIGSIPTDVPPATRVAAQLPVATATDCRYFFFDDNALQSELTRYQGFARGHFDFSDNLRFTGEAGYTSFETATSYTTGETVGASIIIPGHNPGNTFRAVNAAGQPLFAVSSGVAAGFTRDGAPVFLPTRNAQNRVVLTADPTNPASGIPFYEDVTLNARLLGSQCGLPTGNTLRPGECAAMRASRSDNSVAQMAGFFSGKLFDDWDWQAGLSWSQYKLATNGTTGNGLTAELRSALDGLGGPGCASTSARNTGGCQYFNPFGNSAFATAGGTDGRANSQDIIDWVIPTLTDRFKSTLLEGEAHTSGKVFTLPAGDVQVAVGYQFRTADLTGDYDQRRNDGRTANQNTANDFDVSRDNHAVFGEINVPLFTGENSSLEINGAVRHEWIGDTLETTNPKVGILFSAWDNKLTLRGSYGESFVAPSLFRLFGNVGAGAAVTDCPVTQNPVCTGQTNLRITNIISGNPDLKPQTSENYSYGVSLRLFEGLTVSVDNWHYTFNDLITTESATNVVRADPTGANGRVIRNASGQLAIVFTQYQNAPSLETAGVDFEVNYRRPIENVGDFVFNIAGTYVDQYDVIPTPGAAVVHGAGRTNDQPGVVGLVANPRLKVNGRISWSNGPHSAMVLARHIDSLTFSRDLTKTIDSFTPLDVSYTYNWKGEQTWAKDVSITVGAANVFAEVAPFVPFPAFQAFIGGLYDLRGRSVFARVTSTY